MDFSTSAIHSMSMSFATGDTTKLLPAADMKRNMKILFETSDNNFLRLEEMVVSMKSIKKNEKIEKKQRLKELLIESKEDEVYLKKLESERLLITRDLDGVEQKLEDLKSKGRENHNRKREGLQSSENKIARLQYRLEKRKQMNQGIQSFVDKFGIRLGKPMEAELKNDAKKDERCFRTLVFSQLHPFQEKPYVLYFSKLSTDFQSFHVYGALPDFNGFEELAEQSNRSQNIMELARGARKFWLKKIGIKESCTDRNIGK